MAIDKFGNEVPASPGYKRIVSSDGVEVKQEETIFLGANMSATAVAGGTQLDASGTPASSVTLGDMADLAANSVIGNPTGSAATPSAISATATGLGVLAAATQAALTALIAAATTSLAGLMSAADKVKLDAGWVKIEGTITCAAQAIGTKATATWTAGTYKQVKLVIRQYATVNSSGINDVTMVGCTGVYKSSIIYVGSPSAYSGSATAYVGWAGRIASGEFLFDIPAAPKIKMMQGISVVSDASPLQLQVHGASNADTTHDVTGIGIVTINDITSFSYELYGMPA